MSATWIHYSILTDEDRVLVYHLILEPKAVLKVQRCSIDNVFILFGLVIVSLLIKHALVSHKLPIKGLSLVLDFLSLDLQLTLIHLVI